MWDCWYCASTLTLECFCKIINKNTYKRAAGETFNFQWSGKCVFWTKWTKSKVLWALKRKKSPVQQFCCFKPNWHEEPVESKDPCGVSPNTETNIYIQRLLKLSTPCLLEKKTIKTQTHFEEKKYTNPKLHLNELKKGAAL